MLTPKGTSGLGVAAAAALIIWGALSGEPSRPLDSSRSPGAVPGQGAIEDLKAPLLVIPDRQPVLPELTPEQLEQIAAQILANVDPSVFGAPARAGSPDLEALAARYFGGLSVEDIQRELRRLAANQGQPLNVSAGEIASALAARFGALAGASAVDASVSSALDRVEEEIGGSGVAGYDWREKVDEALN